MLSLPQPCNRQLCCITISCIYLQRILQLMPSLITAKPMALSSTLSSVRLWCSLVVGERESGGAWPRASWTVKEPDSSGPEPSGRDLARVQKFKYLGVELHGSSSITAAVGQRLACMVTAQSAVYRRLREMHVIYDPVMMICLRPSQQPLAAMDVRSGQEHPPAQ
jgi:hypothetical protein